ncbi:MAG: 30S ribosomal protein S8 [candidate division WS6 bacterium GW2011_WS6_36_26]|nr:MAG: 30S ribosomal protein S8 [candidate division WS6 bacterium GW2011_WS6_36_26]HAM96782.1 30S ribosomal protein S8 [Patescibacteria group bacterium]
MNDLIADLLARMQNSIMRKERVVNVINTKMNMELLRVLKEEEMIKGFEAKDKNIEVELAYDDKEPVISHFTRVSKLGQRIYVSKKEITPVMNGRGIAIISTPSGLMSGAMAKSKGLGGELICKIW